MDNTPYRPQPSIGITDYPHTTKIKKMLNINIVKIKRLLTQSYKIDKVRLHM